VLPAINLRRVPYTSAEMVSAETVAPKCHVPADVPVVTADLRDVYTDYARPMYVVDVADVLAVYTVDMKFPIHNHIHIHRCLCVHVATEFPQCTAVIRASIPKRPRSAATSSVHVDRCSRVVCRPRRGRCSIYLSIPLLKNLIPYVTGAITSADLGLIVAGRMWTVACFTQTFQVLQL